MKTIRAACTVGGFTLISRFAGFLRELVMAACLGAGVFTDAFLVAVRLASTCRRVFAEGAFSASFLPRFSSILYSKGKNVANSVLSDVFSCLCVIVGFFSVIIMIFYPSVLHIIASGFTEGGYKFDLTVKLGRLCFPYLLLISVVSLFSGVSNAVKQFAIPAAISSLLSIFVITGVGIGYYCGGDYELIVYCAGIAVLLSGLVQAYILYKTINYYGFFLKLRKNWWSPEVKDIMKNMVPGIIAAGIWQLNLLVDTTISSYLPTGTITCVSLADRLNQFPLGTLGIALSTALLPILSECIAKKEFERAGSELKSGLILSFFLSFLSAAILWALDKPSVAIAFQRGAFGNEQVQITATILSGFVTGLPAYIVLKVFASVYFSVGDTKTPVKFGIVSVFINVILLFLIVPFLKYLGLALCTSFSAYANAILLVYFSKEKLPVHYGRDFWEKILAQIISLICTTHILSCLSDKFWDENIVYSIAKWPIYALMCLAAIVVFAVVDSAMLYVFCNKNWKIWKKDSWR